MKRRLPLLLLLVLASAGGGVWMRLHPAPAPRAAPDLAPLRDQLQSAAEKAFPIPTLGGWSLEINVPAAELSARLAALAELAQKLAGSAQRVLDRDRAAVVLVQIPEANRAQFLEMARAWPEKAEPQAATVPGESTDGEVILHPVE